MMKGRNERIKTMQRSDQDRISRSKIRVSTRNQASPETRLLKDRIVKHDSIFLLTTKGENVKTSYRGKPSLTLRMGKN